MRSIRVVQWVFAGFFVAIAVVLFGFGFHYAMQAEQVVGASPPTFAPVRNTGDEKSSAPSKPQQPANPYYHNPNSSVQIDVIR